MLVDALLVGAEREGFAHHLVEVHHRARGLALPGKRQQVADDAGGAFGFAEDDLEPALGLVVEPGRSASRSAHDRIVASGLFSSCATPEMVWPERGHLLGLQQLVAAVARLIVALLALAHVANQRLDPQGRRVCRLHGIRVGIRRGGGDFDPDRRAVDLAKAQQMIRNRAVLVELGREATCAPADRRSATARTAEPGARRSPAGSRRSVSGGDWRRASWRSFAPRKPM